MLKKQSVLYHNGNVGGEQRDYGQNGIPLQHSINLAVWAHPLCPLLNTHRRPRHGQRPFVPRLAVDALNIWKRR